ncbi:MAG TPA: serine/threonine protein kinase, partial [Streptomyces sp.]|nr:serine/threonine protein kinase [Streptomyces sp.]
YEAVEGVPPFLRDNWVETAYAASSEPPRPMERAGALRELIERLLEKDPEERLTLEQAEDWLSGIGATARLPVTEPAPPPGPVPAPREDTSVAPAAPLSGRTAGGDPTPGRRRGVRAMAWVTGVVFAAAAAGGGWWLIRGEGEADGSPSPGPSASQSASPSQSATPARPPVAAGYHRVKDELGFSVDVPDGWTRKAEAGGEQVDYVAPNGRTGLKFGVLDFAGKSPINHWRQLEPEVREKSPGYTKLRMNATTYLGQDAAIWEYTWQGRERAYHAVDLGFGTEGERHYAVYLSAPDAEWATSKKYFDTAVKTFRVTPQG